MNNIHSSPSRGKIVSPPLAPFLFVWVVDYILRKATEETGIGYSLVKKNGRRGSELKISDLAFADADVALLANNIVDSQTLLLAVEKMQQKLDYS